MLIYAQTLIVFHYPLAAQFYGGDQGLLETEPITTYIVKKRGCRASLNAHNHALGCLKGWMSWYRTGVGRRKSINM